MSAHTPPEPEFGPSGFDRFPWSAVVIIAISLVVVGWMVITAGSA